MDRYLGELIADANPSQGVQGTELRAAWGNMLTEEMRNVLLAAGIIPVEAEQTQLASAIVSLAGIHGSLRNPVVNGDFQVWQRGTSFGGLSGNEAYTADRWAVRADQPGGAGTASIQRVAFAAGQSDVPGNPRYHASYAQLSTATAGAPRIATRIEDARTFAGETVTVSVYLRSSNAITVLPTLTQDFGNLGSPSAAGGQDTWNLSAAWERFEWTVALPTISGATVGEGSFLELGLVLPSSGTFAVEVGPVQIEPGSAATRYESRPFPLEVLLCQRYYEKSYPYAVDPGAANEFRGSTRGGFDEGTNAQNLETRFRVEKRTTPAVAIYNPFTGHAGTFRWGDDDLIVTNLDNPSTSATGVPVVGSYFMPPARNLMHWTADAEL